MEISVYPIENRETRIMWAEAYTPAGTGVEVIILPSDLWENEYEVRIIRPRYDYFRVSGDFTWADLHRALPEWHDTLVEVIGGIIDRLFADAGIDIQIKH